jgi:hypothetical protein
MSKNGGSRSAEDCDLLHNVAISCMRSPA